LLKLGVQVSSAGKIYYSLERAKELGCNVMQIFARNPRQIRRSSLSKEDIEIFRKKAKKEKINPIAIHIPYTLNLATAKLSFYKITIKEFIQDLLEADKLGADFLVTHLGSYKDSEETFGLKRIVKALKEIIRETRNTKTVILLENTSGGGSLLGGSFSHHRYILENLNWHSKLGICLDTAHAWAAGYKIDDLKGINELVEEIDYLVGLERLKLIHLNDTKERLGSKKDRHFHIGEGRIGKRGFYFLLHHPLLKNLPFILETPKKTDTDDLKNLSIVKKLYYDDEVYFRN
jgi:deoxyribonuclease-4